MLTVKHNINPTLKMIMTAGMADSFKPSRTIAPGNWINENITLTIVITVALKDSRMTNTQTNAAANVKARVRTREVLRSIYCSQNINGIPVKKREISLLVCVVVTNIGKAGKQPIHARRPLTPSSLN